MFNRRSSYSVLALLLSAGWVAPAQAWLGLPPLDMVATIRDSVNEIAVFRTTVSTPINAAVFYTIVDLGTLGGGTSDALGMDNGAGSVVGQADTGSGTRHAFIYRDGMMTDLGALTGGSDSQAVAVNDAGMVAGDSGINEYGAQFSEGREAFVWENGQMQSLGALYCPCSFNKRYGSSSTHAMNAAGQVVGESGTLRGEWVRHAFLWQNGAMQDIGGGAGDWSISRAFSINDRGQVVGDYAQDAGRLGMAAAFDRHAFLWQNNVRRDLGTPPGYASSTALAINLSGQIVGWCGTSDGSVSHAYLWENNLWQDLSVLSGDMNSMALGINAAGDVVGWSGTSDRSVSRAFLWRSGQMFDLNRLTSRNSGWLLTQAVDINDAGEITGTGLHHGQRHAFLLKPLTRRW